jgi:hypothetical protein
MMLIGEGACGVTAIPNFSVYSLQAKVANTLNFISSLRTLFMAPVIADQSMDPFFPRRVSEIFP